MSIMFKDDYDDASREIKRLKAELKTQQVLLESANHDLKRGYMVNGLQDTEIGKLKAKLAWEECESGHRFIPMERDHPLNSLNHKSCPACLAVGWHKLRGELSRATACMKEDGEWLSDAKTERAEVLELLEAIRGCDIDPSYNPSEGCPINAMIQKLKAND